MKILLLSIILFLGAPAAWAEPFKITGSAGSRLVVEPIAAFNEPWAMTFLPDGRLLITEKPGRLLIFNPATSIKTEVAGLPRVAYGGQGGLGDVILHPDFQKNRIVYLSYAEHGTSGEKGAAVAKAILVIANGRATLEDLAVIWHQKPKVRGNGHYSGRLAFSPDGDKLYITSGERQKQQPAQKWDQNLGKVIRINPDGSIPPDNPFQNKGELAKSFWTLGHRNLLGMAFDSRGRLWTHEMGPRNGDELNLIVEGQNYGWPVVSWGDHYSGIPIPDHNTRPDFKAPEIYWDPTIAPSGLVIYHGALFPSWKGNGLIGGLRSKSLIRVDLDYGQGELERFPMGKRIREVEQASDGALWLLEDRKGARLLRITPDT